MAERLLLTGASGFVARAIVAPLAARGFEVHAVSRRGPRGALAVPHRPSGHRREVVWHEADLLRADNRRALVADVRPDVLLHAAWYVEHGRFWQAPENAEWLDASRALFAMVADAGARRILGVGTCAEYAAQAEQDDHPWPESRPIRPGTPYGVAKAALGSDALALGDRHPRCSVAWARLFHLFGPAEPPARLVPSVARALIAGREAACASGAPIRDFADTGWVGRVLAAVVASDATGPINVAPGEGTTIRAVVNRIGAIAGRPDLIRFGALPDRAGEVPCMIADTTRLRKAVGVVPPIELDAALAEVVALTRLEFGCGDRI